MKVYEMTIADIASEIFDKGEDFAEKIFNDIDELEKNKLLEIEQLKQQLAEKDKEIAHLKEKDNYHLRYELAGADETITNLKEQLAEKDIRIEELEGQFAYECECNKQLVELQKQLEEKQNTIDEINKEFVQAVHDWKALCADKDKEIEMLNAIKNNAIECADLFKVALSVRQKDLAIQELEKVKENLKQLEINIDNQAGFSQGYKLELKQKSLYKNVYKTIDQQIKELKGDKDVED